MDVEGLTNNERLELMRFLCSFAWADNEVQAEEQVVLMRVLEGLEFSAENRSTVESWLASPPDMEGFDFSAVPRAKREFFLDLAFDVATAHGGLAAEELGHLEMFMTFNRSA